MKNIGQVINLEKLAAAREEKAEAQNTCVMAQAMVDLVFKQMKSACKNFNFEFNANDLEKLSMSKRQWAYVFSKNGIKSKEQIKRGIERLIMTMPKNTPSAVEFLDWCVPAPEEIGLPKESVAFRIALRINEKHSTFVHPNANIDMVIRHAIKALEGQAFRNMTLQNAQKAFKYAYENTCKKFAKGMLSDIPKAITDKPQEHPIDKEKAEEARQKNMPKIWEILK